MAIRAIRKRLKVAAWAALGTSILWVFGHIVVGKNLVHHLYKAEECSPKGEPHHNDKVECESFFEKTLSDPVAFYTLTLVFATGFLAIYTAGLWRATIKLGRDSERSIRASEDSAKAAMQSAKIAEAGLIHVERPWLIVENFEVSWRTVPASGPLPPNDWLIAVNWKNVGRMPAITTELLIQIAEIGDLGPIPDYAGAGTSPILRTMASGEISEGHSLGPSGKVLKDDGTPKQFVVFGRVTYSELDRNRIHHTGFAVQVSAHMPAASGYRQEAYEYWD